MKLTIRDLFWLVLVVSLGLAWWLDRGALARENQWIVQQLHKIGAEIGTANSGERAIVWPGPGVSILRQMGR